MVYHQQFKGLPHVIISCFTSVEMLLWFPTPWFIPYKAKNFNKITLSVTGFPGDVADVMVTLSPTLLRFLVEISEFQLAFMMIVLYFWKRKRHLCDLTLLNQQKIIPRFQNSGYRVRIYVKIHESKVKNIQNHLILSNFEPVITGRRIKRYFDWSVNV